jgi:hypothetical protein
MSVEEGASVSRPLEGRDENAGHVGTGEKNRDVHAWKVLAATGHACSLWLKRTIFRSNEA